MTQTEMLKDMAMNMSHYGLRTKRGALLAAAAEIERLQRIIDSRPAINAGLPQTYIEWSQGIYQADVAQAIGHDA